MEAIPSLGPELARAGSEISGEINANGLGRTILLVVLFVGAGVVVQRLYAHWSRPLRQRVVSARLDTVRGRLIAIGSRLILNTLSVLSFAAGSIGAFLAFNWPPLTREILIGYLAAAVLFRLAQVVLETLLAPAGSKFAPGAEGFRVIPVTNEAAAFWARRISFAAAWFAFGWVTVSLLTAAFGFPLPTRQLVAYCLGIVLLVMGIEAVWNRPHGYAAAVGVELSRPARAPAKNWFWSAFLFLLWLSWVAGAMRLFWLAAVAVALPGAVLLVQQSVNNLMRPFLPGQDAQEVPSILAAFIERGVRTLLIVAAVLFLMHKWQIDIIAITAQDTFAMRAVRGIFSAVVVVLLADFAWRIMSALIDAKLAGAAEPGETGSEAARRNARLRTLLPILRNVLLIVVVVVALLMALSSIGVDIGPLIAGAGVLGVAIGFGAQTVVKDIISGAFYIMDDAFRIGEYIESGSYKGTVEFFSLRSVKLRHQRGPIFIVPFSDLGAVQNMSRDWAIEKMTLTVTYDSDIAKARTIVKKIGLELAEDPEFKASIIEPLKMQGIDSFGDLGVVMRMKLKTRPGEQFGIKRKALMMIKEAFDANGIKLAVPTVQITGGGGTADISAAAQRALALAKAKKTPPSSKGSKS